MDDVIISKRSKMVWHTNCYGMTYSDIMPLKGYEVSGGFFQRTVHMTLENAQKEAELRREMIRNHPFNPPRSQREIEKAKRLGLDIEREGV